MRPGPPRSVGLALLWACACDVSGGTGGGTGGVVLALDPSQLEVGTSGAAAVEHCSAPPPPLTGYVSIELADQDAANVVDLAIADLNRDGHADVVVTRGGTHDFEAGTVEILYGPHVVPSGSPCREARAAAPARPSWRSCAAGAGCERKRYGKLALGDLDGDGCLDVVAGKYQGGAEIFYGVVDGARCLPASNAVLLEDSAAFADVVLLSVDGDADLDLVAARWSGAPEDNRGFAPAVFLNEGGALPSTPSYLLEDRLVHALTVTELDLDGDGARDDVLFGARAVEEGNGQRSGLWGVGYLDHDGSLEKAGRRFARPGSNSFVDAPFVIGLAPLLTSGRPDAVVASSTVHWCATSLCSERSLPAAYRWDGATMALEPLLGPQASGNWLAVATGSLDSDGVGDVALSLPCGDYQSPSLRPGRLVVLRSGGAPAYAPSAALEGQHIVRALAVGDLDPALGPGSHDVVYGTAVTTTTEAARVHALLRCTPTEETDP